MDQFVGTRNRHYDARVDRTMRRDCGAACKWDERPIIIAVTKSDHTKSKDSSTLFEEVLGLLRAEFPKWQMPEALVLVDELPLTATGKISKLQLRQIYRDYFGEKDD